MDGSNDMVKEDRQLKELAEYAKECTQGDSEYGKDCLYWLYGKCKYNKREQVQFQMKRGHRTSMVVPVRHNKGYCQAHRSRKQLGVGEAIGA